MLKKPFLSTGGVGLHVEASRETGPPLVLLHGVTRRWQDWLTVLPPLTERWQVFAMDLRGHGLSARTPGAYRIADYVGDVIDFVRRLTGTGQAVLVGHSLGANVAASVAAAVPDRVHALVLEDPPLGIAGPRLAETYFDAMFRVYLKYAGSDKPVSTIAAELAETRVSVPGRAEPVRIGDIRDLVTLRVSASGLKKLDPGVLEVALAGRWLDGSDLVGDLRKITCPTLLLQADPALGGALPDDHAKEMAALVRDVVHIKLDGVGHQIHATAAEAMMRLVLPFLGALD